MSLTSTKKIMIFLTVLVGSGMPGGAATAEEGAPAATMINVTPARDAKLAEGAEGLYDSVCGYCHGVNVGPVILGRNLDPDTIMTFVRTGVGGMPAFRPTEINDTPLRDLANWISQSKPDPTEHGN